MATHKITKGLDIPIAGRPRQVIRRRAAVTRVAVVADDFPGMKPRMHVEEGETVKRGQVLFENRKKPGVLHTAPGAGRIIGIHRGARRALQSIVIDLSDSERAGSPGPDEIVSFASYTGKPAEALTRTEIRDLLIESGMWTALRTRPYSKSPGVDATPAAVFVTAIDTAPLAPLPDVVLADRLADFERGLRVLSMLTEGRTYLCIPEHADWVAKIDAPVSIESFSGPHPAGTPGLHIHLLEPVSRHKSVWHVGYQDVVAIGHLCDTGELDVERVVSLAGPLVRDPALVRTRLGGCVDDIVEGHIESGVEARLIAGDVLSGKRADGEIFGFLGRFDRQISVVAEDRERRFLGWLGPGTEQFSVFRLFLSNLLGKKEFDLTTSTHGSPRPMVPFGTYEDVMPLDILPTFLLRSMIVGDLERAEALGALELDEEDVALCTFVCPSKIVYGPILRRSLELIETEG
jgi:Na+-transporting NADH:ubiquinone oxidoreductase subunit A